MKEHGFMVLTVKYEQYRWSKNVKREILAEYYLLQLLSIIISTDTLWVYDECPVRSSKQIKVLEKKKKKKLKQKGTQSN